MVRPRKHRGPSDKLPSLILLVFDLETDVGSPHIMSEGPDYEPMCFQSSADPSVRAALRAF